MQHIISVRKKEEKKKTCFGDLFIFCGLPTREPSSIICYGKQDDDATKNTVKGEVWKNEGEWTEKVEFTKEEIPGCRGSMQGYLLTYRML